MLYDFCQHHFRCLERNRNRDRVLPEKIVVDSHRQVIKNIGGFQGLFGGNNFLIIDNNKDLTEEQQKRFNMLIKKGLSKFIKKPIQNPRGKSWVRKQKMLETYTSENGTTLLLERVDFRQNAKELMRRYRVHSKLEFSSQTKGDYDFDRDIIKLRPFYSNIRDFLIHYYTKSILWIVKNMVKTNLLCIHKWTRTRR